MRFGNTLKSLILHLSLILHVVKKLIAPEAQGIFRSNCILVYLNIVQPLVCKTVMNLLVVICRKSQYLFYMFYIEEYANLNHQ